LSFNFANNRAWADALLRAVEKDGYGCEFMQDALKLFPGEVIEKKLEEAKARKLKKLHCQQSGRDRAAGEKNEDLK
jgi:hypothetical protein